MNPIYPQPTHISSDGPLAKYSWNVSAKPDGSMISTAKIAERVNMIWWEAIRIDGTIPLDVDDCVCVPLNEISTFLSTVLYKKGVRISEYQPFSIYWDHILKSDPAKLKKPFVLVQLINPDRLSQYVPEIQIEGENAQQFGLKRYFFRFVPMALEIAGMSVSSYLERLDQMDTVDLGPNAVIDLGGEIESFSTTQVSGKGMWAAADMESLAAAEAFNQSFIKNYVISNVASDASAAAPSCSSSASKT